MFAAFKTSRSQIMHQLSVHCVIILMWNGIRMYLIICYAHYLWFMISIRYHSLTEEGPWAVHLALGSDRLITIT